MLLQFIIVTLLLFLIINIIYFISRTLSPIPFFPTNKKDLPLIITSLLSTHSQHKKSVIIDLGAGTGTVIFPAAEEAYKRQRAFSLKSAGGAPGGGPAGFTLNKVKEKRWDEGATGPAQIESSEKSTTQFIAVEIHPLLIFIMHLRRLLHPNRKNIHIIRADIFNTDLKKNLTLNFKFLTLYLYVGPFVMSRLKPVLKSFPARTRIVSYMYEIPGWDKKLIKTRKGVKKLYVYLL